ncbi:uncharacterized protein LOC128039852 [Gossypium raimondii]|uniref:uncharacterized protein LOC128039852 n=1 Tax=Gossypium raimondii TaxID=29730 RepID=UPI00227D06CC|nr:uncharacterized protein LOC128039852 [Gossypium raimondii]
MNLYNQDPSDEVLAEIMEVQLRLNLEADKEELFWEQRARVNWLKNGDRNTSFFHKVAVQRHYRCRVFELEDGVGRSTNSTEEFLQIATDYFGKLFTASESGSNEHLLSLVEEKVTCSMNERLLRQFTEEDIACAGQEDLSAINKTRLILIPKVGKSSNMTHFRPISLCNVIYKIIAKVLVLRMSEILGTCINEAQGASIPGRLISDNVLIAYEILHSLKMKKRGKKGNFALKLDMSKVNDRVECDFLPGMMRHLGFHEDWIVLIMCCVCFVTYSVSLNGASGDWFTPSRGLRQGDPLSSYLFLICVEGFSLLIQEAKTKEMMMGAPIGREKFSVNHLFFADDCVLFGDASREGAEVVRAIIHEYEMVSGQRVNFEKSHIYFGANVDSSVQEDIVNLFGVRLASNPEKYLGLPLMVGRRKKWAFAHFVDRFRKRVEGWSMRYLSMGAKSARDLISDGILWRVGNGTSINIWNDPWLLGRENNRIPVNEIKPHWSTVNQLMNEVDSTWNRELIHNLVDDVTANRIFAIPISESRPEDMVVWKYEGSGEYTVRSGYRVLITDYLQSNIHMSSTNEEYNNFYIDLWALHIPEKIKIHVWRLFNNMVPHYENLASRTLCEEAVCPLCKEDLETTEHLLGFCRVLQTIWTSLQVQTPPLDASLDYKANFVKTYLEAEGRQKRFIALSLWCLWFHRNNLIHEGTKFSVPHLLGFIRGYERDLWLIRENLCVSTAFMRNEVWRPPDYGLIKFNFYASFIPGNNFAIIAILARNHKGEVIEAVTYLVEDVDDAFVAEARACKRALILAKLKGF